MMVRKSLWQLIFICGFIGSSWMGGNLLLQADTVFQQTEAFIILIGAVLFLGYIGIIDVFSEQLRK